MRKLRSHLFSGQHETGVVVVDRRTEHHTDHLTIQVNRKGSDQNIDYNIK